MVYGLFCALPGVRDLLVTVARAMRKHHRELGTSQGVPEPHSFAIRVTHRPSSDVARVHRIPIPTSVTVAKRPSRWGTERRDQDTDF